MPPSLQQNSKGTEDIFAKVDPPKRPTRRAAAPKKASPIPSSSVVLPARHHYSILIASLGIVAVLGLIGLGWWLQDRRQTSETQKEQESSNQNTGTQLTNRDTQGNTNAAPVISTNREIEDLPLDSDHDGLSDAEEQESGSNPQSVDSDQDGLTDLLELRVYRSDPTGSDSDGDGNADKDEVDAGYDPAGPGRLFDISNTVNQ